MTQNSCYFKIIPYTKENNLTSSNAINYKKIFSLMLGYDKWNNVTQKESNNSAILFISIANNLEKTLNYYSKIVENCPTFKEISNGWDSAKMDMKKSPDNVLVSELIVYCPYYNLDKKNCIKEL